MQSSEQNRPWPQSYSAKLKRDEFELFRKLISKRCGIQLSDAKLLFIQNRLGKRLRALRMDTFRDYYAYLHTRKGCREELNDFFAAITTNETHFFREPHHFDILKEHILPEVVSQRKSALSLRLWSAGCSTGQEVYTLAMVMDEWLSSQMMGTYSVLGSDINQHVLNIAEGAEYPLELKKEIPSKYLFPYVDVQKDSLKIKAKIRSRVSFRHHNFSEILAQRPAVDVIFCRNAMMYLDPPTRLRLVQTFKESLREGGFLVLGSSESLHGLPKIFETRRFGRFLVYQKRSKTNPHTKS
ncbi:protein-glutamate O-methyltransferase CheR [Myxococcota bacterium]|nr:protein-glutamate O-methyltransferase CheR [Myxococcota bacterium]